MVKYYLFILSFIVTMICNPQLAVSRVAHNNVTDVASLLAFKSGVSDPYNFLATNWTTDVASFCTSWFGVRCSKRHPNRVASLDLRSVFLHGEISPNLGNLSFLSFLHLGSNNLSGTIPASLCQLQRLAFLNLTDNNLSGMIPPAIFNMSSLYRLSSGYNNLWGPLPNFGNSCNRLQFVYLSYNSLSGSIPSDFARCPNFQVLSLTNNKLSGRIPYELGNITKLEELYLGANRLSGNIPASIGNLTMLQILSIVETNIQGSIPEEMGKLKNLHVLQLRTNNLTGVIPTSLLNASSLDILEISENGLSGTVPVELGQYLPKLTDLTMHSNILTGTLQFITSLSNCRDLATFEAGSNKFGGVLPDSIGNLSTNLKLFHISYNYIKGGLPSGIGNLTGLLNLILDGNELTGELPPTLFLKMKALQGLSVYDNKISGSIPFQIGLMTSTNDLDLSYNTLSGPIPYSLGNISTLSYLNLQSNMLSSHIPDTLWSLSGLIGLYLDQNLFDGTLSPKVNNLVSLFEFGLSNNHLSGNIPTTFGKLQMLTYLNLSTNSFSGQIPILLIGLISIEYLILSYNSLSGTIPESFSNLSYLRDLDLSFNKLEGRIPHFSNLSVLSLKGNMALCGAPQLGFSLCSSANSSKSKFYLIKYILPPMIILIVVFITCCLYSLFYRKRETKPEFHTDPNVRSRMIISYHELVRATDNFSDANLLGRGSFASVFKAHLDDGLTVATLKVLNMEHEAALRSFDVECNILSKALHRNLVKIISTCSNFDFKGLVLEYMPNGSLEQWLYSHNNYLSMLQRLNILVDVSLALEYLHHNHPNVILHLDLKPSNVLLDEDMTACVSDFGIAKLLLGDSKSTLSASTPGTFGYIAPEYASTGKVSRKSDIYSFGILVLEMLTRKKPSDSILFSKGISLRQWVTESYPHAVQEIVDPNLQRDSWVNFDECLSSIVELGLQCSSDTPKERMLIKDVVPILEKIRSKLLSETSTPP